jgi:hypothetical protein
MSEFAKSQNLWGKNRKALWREIKIGSRHEGNLSATHVYAHFHEKFSTKNFADNEPPVDLNGPNTTVWVPMTLSEVEAAIKKQKNKASGLDAVTYRSLIKSKIQTLTMTHCCIYAKAVPKDLQSSRWIKKGVGRCG